MSSSLSPELLRGPIYGIITWSLIHWRHLVNSIVPDPYLDEVFHIPQAQAYWVGKWSQWDPKITTPPGLYVFTNSVHTIQKWYNPDFQQAIGDLRIVNLVLLYSLTVLLFIWTATTKSHTSSLVLKKELVTIQFPVLFFFSAFYYTDVLSTVTVVLTYVLWTASNQAEGSTKLSLRALQTFCGLLSLTVRQTNIFWVGVFLGGLQVIEVVKKHVGATRVHDPPIAEAFFEDFPLASISLLQGAIPLLQPILASIWPQLCLLASFATFVTWNQGVVLGDKSNHVATVHTPQMLYLFPLIMFFSWPTILPFVTHPNLLKEHLPRRATVAVLMLVASAVVYFNTIVHPFTLADNRHYTFYIFRYLLAHPAIKYLVIPIYLSCGWLTLLAMGGTQHVPLINRAPGAGSKDTVRVSFVLVWLLSTALSLVSAPLVEPRYFIIPWLIWRMHVPDPISTPEEDDKKHDDKPVDNEFDMNAFLWLARKVSGYNLWVELLWYAAINTFTGYMFLYRGFQWPQEPGNVQRFLW